MNTSQWIYGLVSEVAEAISAATVLSLGNFTLGQPLAWHWIAVFLSVQVIVAEARFILKNGLPQPPPSTPIKFSPLK